LLLLIVLILPIISCIGIAMNGERSRNVRTAILLVPSTVNFFIMIYFYQIIMKNNGHYSLDIINHGLFKLQFAVDKLGLYMGFSMTFLWLMTSLYATGYMEHEHSKPRFFASLILNQTAAMGIIFASNVITMFIFVEFLTIFVYPLIIHEETAPAWNAGIKYGAYLLLGGVSFLMGMLLIYKVTGGNVYLHPGGIPELANQSSTTLWLIFFFCSFGFCFKAGIFPFHSWLPDAMIAPTPVSAVLHAVAVVNVGVFGYYRIIYNIIGMEIFQREGMAHVLMWFLGVTIIGAALIALKQDEIKRMLAFSTINQLSYMIMGPVSGDPAGFVGGMLHIWFHSFMKITLFYCAGLIMTQSGNKYISKMGGLWKKMPITMICFSIAAIGIIGLPPGAGWISKWYLVEAFCHQGKPLWGGIFVVSGMIELGFFTIPIANAFFREEYKFSPEELEDMKHHNHGVVPRVMKKEYGVIEPEPAKLGIFDRMRKEAPLYMLIPVMITCTITVIFGIWGSLPHMFAKPTIIQLLGYNPF